MAIIILYSNGKFLGQFSKVCLLIVLDIDIVININFNPSHTQLLTKHM